MNQKTVNRQEKKTFHHVLGIKYYKNQLYVNKLFRI